MKNVKSISSLQWSLVEQRRCLAESFPYGTLGTLIFLVLYGRFHHGQDISFSFHSVFHFYENMNVLTNKHFFYLSHSLLTSFAIANYSVIHEAAEERDKRVIPLTFYTNLILQRV